MGNKRDPCHRLADVRRRFEGDAVKDVVLAHDDLLGADPLHDRQQYEGPRGDDVHAPRVHGGDRRALGMRGVQQPLGDLTDPVVGDPGVVDGLGVVLGQLLRDRRDGRDGAA